MVTKYSFCHKLPCSSNPKTSFRKVKQLVAFRKVILLKPLNKQCWQTWLVCSLCDIFNTYPGHTLHVDYFELNNRDYLIMVDRLTGFSKCEMTPNKGTDAAIMAIKNWGDQYGYPYKVISDTGPACREDFIKQLLSYNISRVKRLLSSNIHDP